MGLALGTNVMIMLHVVRWNGESMYMQQSSDANVVNLSYFVSYWNHNVKDSVGERTSSILYIHLYTNCTTVKPP